MKKVFVKQKDLKLVNGGYLVTGEKEIPVNNEEFVKAQKHAEYIITFAKMAKGKDFKGKKADSVEDLRNQVLAALESKKETYFELPKAPKMPTHEKLTSEALKFIEVEQKREKLQEVNDFMQQFNVLKEFEEFGLYFDEGITKLNRIYTIEEIKQAVEEVIDLL